MSDSRVSGQELDEPLAERDAVPSPAAPADVVTLPEVLRQVRRDSRKQPQTYLDETTVRYGGE